MEETKRRIGRPKGTGSQRVYDALRARILSLEMPPGAVVDETAVVTEFGVSRTPVREALIRLAKDGFVTLLPNRAASVSSLDINEIPELLEALELCLRVTTRWAAKRRTANDLAAMKLHQREWYQASMAEDYSAMSEANNALHLVIARSAGNRHMTQLYQNLLPQYYRLSLAMLSRAKQYSKSHKKYFLQIDSEHRQMIEAIECCDVELADRLAKEHARLMGERLVEYFLYFSEVDLRLTDPGTYRFVASKGPERPARKGATPSA